MRASFGSAGYEAESLYYGGDNIFAMNPEPTQVGAHSELIIRSTFQVQRKELASLAVKPSVELLSAGNSRTRRSPSPTSPRCCLAPAVDGVGLRRPSAVSGTSSGTGESGQGAGSAAVTGRRLLAMKFRYQNT
jgi:hypothetical protein